VVRLPDIALSSFVHLSWEHFEGNSVFIVIFGYLAAYQGLGKFVAVTAVVMVTSNLYWWLIGPAGAPSAGASGMIWGWVGYSLSRGVFHRDELESEAIFVLALTYAGTSLDLIFPGGAEWQAHIGGLLGGVLCGLALRNHPALLAVRPHPNDEDPTGEPERPVEAPSAAELRRSAEPPGDFARLLGCTCRESSNSGELTCERAQSSKGRIAPRLKDFEHEVPSRTELGSDRHEDRSRAQSPARPPCCHQLSNRRKGALLGDTREGPRCGT
jgi:Rhomboid family